MINPDTDHVITVNLSDMPTVVSEFSLIKPDLLDHRTVLVSSNHSDWFNQQMCNILSPISLSCLGQRRGVIWSREGVGKVLASHVGSCLDVSDSRPGGYYLICFLSSDSSLFCLVISPFLLICWGGVTWCLGRALIRWGAVRVARVYWSWVYVMSRIVR